MDSDRMSISSTSSRKSQETSWKTVPSRSNIWAVFLIIVGYKLVIRFFVSLKSESSKSDPPGSSRWRKMLFANQTATSQSTTLKVQWLLLSQGRFCLCCFLLICETIRFANFEFVSKRICSLAYFDLELIMFELQGETSSSDEEPPPAKKPRRRIRRISERSRRTITAKLPPCHGPDCDQEVFRLLSSLIS